MNKSNKDIIRINFLEILNMPYAAFVKKDNSYVINDFNKKFSELFDIVKSETTLDEIFISQRDEVIELLNNTENNDKLFIYNNKLNKCYEFNITYQDGYYHFIATDCTEIQNIKNAWGQSEALYKAIFNSGEQGIMFVDKNTRVKAFNKRAEELAYSALKMRLRPNVRIVDILPDEELGNFSSHFADALNGKKVVVERKKEIQDSLREEWFELSYLGINEIQSGIKGVSVIVNNITKRKKYEQEMKDLITALKLANKITDENMHHIQSLNDELGKSEAELKALNVKKDKFFSIIAHDLKNPFQGFIGLTKDLEENFHSFSLDELNEYFSTLHSTAKNLFKLLENLLLWSRVQRDSIDSAPENLLLYDLINMNIDIQQLNINAKNLSIKNNVAKDLRVFADLNMLNTIIRNLLSNAIKFTPKSGNIVFSAYSAENMINIDVKDSGVGMTDDTMNKLFRIDTQITTKGTEEEAGTGLGLILCQELVEKNNGKISVESEINKGTKFTFSLPAAKD
jgi:PAS domain S-box-containing protein